MPQSYQWAVQAYRTIGELRDNYTNFSLVVSRNAMDEIASEATAWMRANAPWRDRPDDIKAKQAPSQYEKTHHARQELEAVAVDNPENAKALSEFQAGLGAAKKIDTARLKAENERLRRQHIENLRAQEEEYFAKHGRSLDTISHSRTKEQASYQKLKSLPPSQSVAFAYQQNNRPNIIPIGSLVLRYKNPKDLTYAIWLEVGMGGRYSIIAPAIAYWYPKTVGKVKQMLNLVQYRHLSIASQEASMLERLAFPESSFASYAARETAAEGVPYQPYGTEKRLTKRSANKRTYRKHGRVTYSDY